MNISSGLNLFINRESVNSCSGAQDDNICHRPKLFTEFLPLSFVTCPVWPHGQQSPASGAAHRDPLVNCLSCISRNQCSVWNNVIKSFTFLTSSVTVEPFIYRHIDTNTDNLTYYWLRIAPICDHIHFYYSNMMGVSILQLFHSY